MFDFLTDLERDIRAERDVPGDGQVVEFKEVGDALKTAEEVLHLKHEACGEETRSSEENGDRTYM